MNSAEQVINQIVMGSAVKAMEGGAKAAAILSKNLVALLLALYQQRERSKGEINLTNLEKRFPKINTFKLPEEKLAEFKKQAKRYNILYSVIKPGIFDSVKTEDGFVDIVLAEKDAQKLERIGEKLHWDKEILQSLTSTSITKENIKKEDGKEEEQLIVELEGKDAKGQAFKVNVPLDKSFSNIQEKKLNDFLAKFNFIDMEGVEQQISSADIAGELNKFVNREKKLEQGRKEVINNLYQENENAIEIDQVEKERDEAQIAKTKNEEQLQDLVDQKEGSSERDISLTSKLNEIEEKKINIISNNKNVRLPEMELGER